MRGTFGTGTGVFQILSSCWSCQGTLYCNFNYPKLGSFRLGPYGATGNVTTIVGVPGGGPYRLVYDIQNIGGYGNSWMVVIEALTGPSFPAIILDSQINAATFDYTTRQLGFNLPNGTTSVHLTFNGRNVSPGRPPSPPPCLTLRPD